MCAILYWFTGIGETVTNTTVCKSSVHIFYFLSLYFLSFPDYDSDHDEKGMDEIIFQ